MYGLVICMLCLLRSVVLLNTVRQSTSERMVEEFGIRGINNGFVA